MSDQDIIDTIAAAAHPWESYVADDGNKSVRSLESPAIAANVFAALSERYAIVPRPEPPSGGYEHIVESGKKRYAIVELPDHPAQVLIGGELESVYVNDRAEASTNEPSITISGTVSIYADEAAPLAAALLAAADAAEEEVEL